MDNGTKAGLITAVLGIVLVAVATLFILGSYDPNPVLDVMNDCTTQIVGNCKVTFIK